MGKRLSRIYTRTGDQGTTGLGDGARVAKTSPRIEAIGDVDELNSQLGVLLAMPLPEAVRALLMDIQHDLFDLGGELSMPGMQIIRAEDVQRIEQAIDAHNAALPALDEFILPGGSPQAAAAHVARAVCRRAERSLLRLTAVEDLRPEPAVYLNRLSDLLFVLGRVLAREAGGREVCWDKNRRRRGDGP